MLLWLLIEKCHDLELGRHIYGPESHLAAKRDLTLPASYHLPPVQLPPLVISLLSVGQTGLPPHERTESHLLDGEWF